MRFVYITFFLAGIAFASGPNQNDHLNGAYQAKSRTEAIDAESMRHLQILSHLNEMERAAQARHHNRSKVCAAMTPPASTDCARQNTAEFLAGVRVVAEARREENLINLKNVKAIDDVWSGRGNWNPGATADARRRAEERQKLQEEERRRQLDQQKP